MLQSKDVNHRSFKHNIWCEINRGTHSADNKNQQMIIDENSRHDELKDTFAKQVA